MRPFRNQEGQDFWTIGHKAVPTIRNGRRPGIHDPNDFHAASHLLVGTSTRGQPLHGCACSSGCAAVPIRPAKTPSWTIRRNSVLTARPSGQGYVDFGGVRAGNGQTCRRTPGIFLGVPRNGGESPGKMDCDCNGRHERACWVPNLRCGWRSAYWRFGAERRIVQANYRGI